jgi:hypothetical protein
VSDALTAEDADILTPLTRVVLYGAGALAVVAGPVLFLWPGDTGSYFAWEIGNDLTPVYMGANYLAGIGAVWGAQVNRWSVTRVTMPALVVFVLTQLGATLLHLDVFKWSHPVAWAWLAVYIGSPVAAIPVALAQERRWRAFPPARSAPSAPVRPLFVLLAGLSLVVGLGLSLAPTLMSEAWPWSLTPLTGRVVGGWILSGAFLYWMIAREPVLERARIGLTSVVVVMTLLLVGAALHSDDFDGPGASVAVYVVYSVVAGAVALVTLLQALRRDRQAVAPARDAV